MTQLTKKLGFASAIGAALLLTGAPARAEEAAEARPVEKHHSKLKGAVVGGVAGAAVGRSKKSAAAGAAGGALWQHHKNKKALKEQNKAKSE